MRVYLLCDGEGYFRIFVDKKGVASTPVEAVKLVGSELFASDRASSSWASDVQVWELKPSLPGDKAPDIFCLDLRAEACIVVDDITCPTP